MVKQDYKTWIIIGLLAITVIIIVVFLSTRSSYRTEPVGPVTRADIPPPRSTPLIQQSAEIDKVFPVDELGIENKSPEELALIGDQYFEGNNYAQAVEIYKKVLEMNPNDIDTYNDLGLSYFYTKRPNLAIDTLKKGSEVNPSYQRIWLSLGFIQMSTGLNDAARDSLQKAIDLNPDNDVGIEAEKMLKRLQ